MAARLAVLLISPALVVVSTIAARRWGTRLGGVIGGFPAVVGPVLLISALGHGAAFTVTAANGTLLGLVSLSGFALGYGRASRRFGWPGALAIAWAGAAAAGFAAAVLGPRLTPPGGVIAASISLLLAYRMLPQGCAKTPAGSTQTRGDLALRAAAAMVLVSALALAVGRLGPLIGGMLAALPVLASVLAVFTHRQQGSGAVSGLLRGLLVGMISFTGFCEAIVLLTGPTGLATAFGAASLTAVLAQAVVMRAGVGAAQAPGLSEPLAAA